MIFISVGTFKYGFDKLLKDVDYVCDKNKLDCYAQSGDSTYSPRSYKFVSFIDKSEMLEAIEHSDLVISHGGIGIIGDVIRKSKPLIIYPRIKDTDRKNPANNQLPLANKISELYGVPVCVNALQLESAVIRGLNMGGVKEYLIGSDIPELITSYLSSSGSR